MLTGVVVVAAFIGLAVLGAALVAALFRVGNRSPDGGMPEEDAETHKPGDFAAS